MYPTVGPDKGTVVVVVVVGGTVFLVATTTAKIAPAITMARATITNPLRYQAELDVVTIGEDEL